MDTSCNHSMKIRIFAKIVKLIAKLVHQLKIVHHVIQDNFCKVPIDKFLVVLHNVI